MRAIGKARGPLYRQLTLRAHAHRLASPFDGEGQVPWNEGRSRELFLDNTPAVSFGARVRTALAADYVDVLGRIQVPTGRPPATAPVRRAEHLRLAILAAQREGNRLLIQALKPHGITPSQAEVLRLLQQHGTLSLSGLGQLLVCESGTNASRLVDRVRVRVEPPETRPDLLIDRVAACFRDLIMLVVRRWVRDGLA
ncbi:hypothetical protein [Embleya sp. NPDC059237]|uniref:hypothetical protein n=1 Tax=Embleya sp. NPDC059237 TaxID=3346784 RepID=UPI00369D5B96